MKRHTSAFLVLCTLLLTAEREGLDHEVESMAVTTGDIDGPLCLGSTSVREYIEKNFENHVRLLRRGAANNRVQPSFTRLVLRTWGTVRTSQTRHVRVDSLCLTPEEMDGLQNDATKAFRIQKMMKRKLRKAKNPRPYFYLCRADFRELPPLPYHGKRALDAAWTNCRESLKHSVNDFNAFECTLPDVLEVFYDPHERQGQIWKNTFLLNKNRNHLMPCFDFFYETMAVVIRMKLLSVSEHRFHMVTSHMLKFIFKFIRANRIDCARLKVPNVHLLQYNGRFDQWTSHRSEEDVANTQMITAADMVIPMRDTASKILTFSSYGVGSYYQIDEDDKIVEVVVWDDLVGDSQMRHFQRLLKNRILDQSAADSPYLSSIVYWVFDRFSIPHGSTGTDAAGNRILHGRRSHRQWMGQDDGRKADRASEPKPEQVVVAARQALGERLSESVVHYSKAECENPSWWMYVESLKPPLQCCGSVCVQLLGNIDNLFGFTYDDCCAACNRANSCHSLYENKQLSELVLGVTVANYSSFYEEDKTMICDDDTVVIDLF